MDDILLHSVNVNPKNWENYANFPGSACSFEVYKLVNELCTNHRASISRKLVMDACNESPLRGLLLAFIWGYPKGRFPGGKSFLPLFDRAIKIVEVLRFLKANPGLPTVEIAEMFKELKGLGPSTYTKILYFFGIRAREGKCLIYDQMVMRSIAESSEPMWSNLRETIGPFRLPAGKFKLFSRAVQEKTYGNYISIAHQIANGKKTADAVEFDLFLNAPRGVRS